MYLFEYTEEGSCWVYKPMIETDLKKIAEAEHRFDELLKRLEADRVV